MCPRRYRPDRRRAALEETRRRIVEATVDLHAEHGVGGTTYAMIAARADVAVPTVYNHFPTRADILGACSGHVAARIPPPQEDALRAEGDPEARLRLLAHLIFAYYREMAPWLRWAVHEAAVVPELRGLIDTGREHRRRLVAVALEPGFGAQLPTDLLALGEVLLDFPAWQRLSEDAQHPPGAAAALVGDALVALARWHGAGEGGVAARPRARQDRKRERSPG